METMIHIFILEDGGIQAVYQGVGDIEAACDKAHEEFVGHLDPGSDEWEDAWDQMEFELKAQGINAVPWGKGYTYSKL